LYYQWHGISLNKWNSTHDLQNKMNANLIYHRRLFLQFEKKNVFYVKCISWRVLKNEDLYCFRFIPIPIILHPGKYFLVLNPVSHPLFFFCFKKSYQLEFASETNCDKGADINGRRVGEGVNFSAHSESTHFLSVTPPSTPLSFEPAAPFPPPWRPEQRPRLRH
jgi:hypothetical protein